MSVSTIQRGSLLFVSARPGRFIAEVERSRLVIYRTDQITQVVLLICRVDSGQEVYQFLVTRHGHSVTANALSADELMPKIISLADELINSMPCII